MEIVHTRDNSERSPIIKDTMQSAGVINVIDHVKSTGLNRERIIIPPVKFIFSSVNTASATLGSPPLLKNKKADPIGFSVLRDTNKIGRSNKFVLKTL